MSNARRAFKEYGIQGVRMGFLLKRRHKPVRAVWPERRAISWLRSGPRVSGLLSFQLFPSFILQRIGIVTPDRDWLIHSGTVLLNRCVSLYPPFKVPPPWGKLAGSPFANREGSGTVLVDLRRPPKADSGGCSKFRSANRGTKQVSAAEPEET